jgi:hypothetical protein
VAEKSLENVKLVNKVYQTMPLRKIASVKDCANSILFLSSDKMAGHISGNILNVSNILFF